MAPSTEKAQEEPKTDEEKMKDWDKAKKEEEEPTMVRLFPSMNVVSIVIVSNGGVIGERAAASSYRSGGNRP